jgi:hypothetical protein
VQRNLAKSQMLQRNKALGTWDCVSRKIRVSIRERSATHVWNQIDRERGCTTRVIFSDYVWKLKQIKECSSGKQLDHSSCIACIKREKNPAKHQTTCAFNAFQNGPLRNYFYKWTPRETISKNVSLGVCFEKYFLWKDHFEKNTTRLDTYLQKYLVPA